MTAGELLVRATAWLAFVAYIGGTAVALRRSAGRTVRLIWPAGAVLLLVHLLAAFHFKHGWSHTAAYEDTARQTREITGLDWGGGLYLNYLLVILWLVDAAGRLRADPAAIPLALRRSFTAFYAFIWFNAAVIFARGPMRWAGVAMFVLLAVLVWRCSRPTGGTPASDPAR